MNTKSYADRKEGIEIHFFSPGGKFNVKALDRTKQKFIFNKKTITASLIDAVETYDPANCRIVRLSQQQVWHNSSPSNIQPWRLKEFEKVNKRKMSQDEILLDSLQGMASDFGAYRFEIL
jgi:hypothetical protein